MTLRRHTPLRRSRPGADATPRTALKRGKPVKKKNAKRRAKEFVRCYGSTARVEWVKSLPCLACVWSNAVQRTPSQNAHTVGGGGSRKADANTIVPLCDEHHKAYDQYRGVFAVPDVREAMKREAKRVDDEWQRYSENSR